MNEQQRKREREKERTCGSHRREGNNYKEQREIPTDLLLTMRSEINNVVRVCAQHYILVNVPARVHYRIECTRNASRANRARGAAECSIMHRDAFRVHSIR